MNIIQSKKLTVDFRVEALHSKRFVGGYLILPKEAHHFTRSLDP
jgi:hypothetical protein